LEERFAGRGITFCGLSIFALQSACVFLAARSTFPPKSLPELRTEMGRPRRQKRGTNWPSRRTSRGTKKAGDTMEMGAKCVCVCANRELRPLVRPSRECVRRAVSSPVQSSPVEKALQLASFKLVQLRTWNFHQLLWSSPKKAHQKQQRRAISSPTSGQQKTPLFNWQQATTHKEQQETPQQAPRMSNKRPEWRNGRPLARLIGTFSV